MVVGQREHFVVWSTVIVCALGAAALSRRSVEFASLASALVGLSVVGAITTWAFSRHLIKPEGDLAAPRVWGVVGASLGLLSIIAVTGSSTIQSYIVRGGSILGVLGTWLESSIFGLIILGWIIAPLGAAVGLILRFCFSLRSR